MGSFGRYCEVVGDSREPTGRRFRALGHAVQRYSSLTGTSYQSVFTELATRCGLWRGRADMGAPLHAAALELARARQAFLEHDRAVAVERKLAKRAGQRLPPTTWRRDLRSAALLGQPLPVSLGSVNSTGVLDGFLGTFTSRYSSFDRYWLFGFLVDDLDTLELDLLTGPPGSPTTPLETTKYLAFVKFQDQLAKRALSPACLAAARLTLTRGKPSSEPAGDRVRFGYMVDFACEVDDGRSKFQLTRTLFVAPHDARFERRSAR